MQSTKKITRAMELIASSRIVRAQAAVRAAQPYSDGITNVTTPVFTGQVDQVSPVSVQVFDDTRTYTATNLPAPIPDSVATPLVSTLTRFMAPVAMS